MDQECIVWKRALRKGYGFFKFNGKQVSAHRYFYEKKYGKIPEGMVLDHLCRNRACINPDHLEVVTTAENNRRGLRTKLKMKSVEKIREMWRVKSFNQTQLGRMFGVGQDEISRIVNRKIWI